VAELQDRIAKTHAKLAWANGEYAMQLGMDLRVYRIQLADAIALTAGSALCENS
jgi:hypothetical protein